MKILITGATGFVGGHLMRYLGGLGYDIESLSKAEMMAEDWSRLDDIRLDRQNIKEGALTYKEKNKPDVLIHCGWIREGDLHALDHLEMAELSCVLIQECANRGIRVINIGSSSEYGVKYEPMKEDIICEPINTYGIAKLSVTLFAKKLGFNTLRLFTVTGEGGHSFYDIHKKVEKWSNPMDVRDYVSVGEVCVAVERLLYATHLYGEIINCGSGQQANYAEVQRENYSVTDSEYQNHKWHKFPQRQYEPRYWVASTEKIERLLNA